MTYDLTNEAQAAQFKARCNDLYAKKAIVNLTEKRPQRSLSQNAYMHLAIRYFAARKGYTAEEVKEWYFKQWVNPDIFQSEAVIDKITRGPRVRTRSSASLTSEEMTTAIDRFRNWASNLGEESVYIPAPDDYRAIAQAEREIEQCKEFI